MEFTVFMSFSIIEYLSVIFGMLALYRFKVQHYIVPSVVISLVCSFLSHALNFKYQMNQVAPIIQLGVFIVLFWLMFRVRFLYSFVMVGTFTIAYVAIQSIIIVTFPVISWFTPDQLHKVDSPQTYSMQLICSIINLVVAWLLMRTRIGFTFIPTSEQERYVWSKRGLQLMSFVIIGICVNFITYYFYATRQVLNSIFIVLISALTFILILLYFSKAKEYEE